MPSTLSTQREAPAEETAPILGWSSLPNDLIYRIGDCLLADENVESYVDFRSVCKGWRDPTMGPKEVDRAKPGRFPRSKWALLDRRDDDLTFVNVETGRFLVKNIPILSKYIFVGATGGGMIILEEPIPPYQVRVLNPFTGLVLCFKASLPIMGWVREAAVTTSPMMLFVSGKDDNVLWADENSEHFHEFQAEYRNTPISMASFGSKVYLADRGGSILSSTHVAADAVGGEHKDRSAQTVSMAKTICSRVAGHPAWDCYLVKSGEELLLVTRPWYNVHGEPVVVRKVDMEKNKLDRLRSIGNQALFLSDVRCLSVDADKFHGIEGGCIYFVDPILTAGNHQASLMTTFRVDEQVQDDIVFDPVTTAGGSQQPFTLSQVFANYCMSTYCSKRGSN